MLNKYSNTLGFASDYCSHKYGRQSAIVVNKQSGYYTCQKCGMRCEDDTSDDNEDLTPYSAF